MIAAVLDQGQPARRRGGAGGFRQQPILGPLVHQDFARAAALGSRALDQPAVRGHAFRLEPHGPAVGRKHAFFEVLGTHEGQLQSQRLQQSPE